MCFYAQRKRIKEKRIVSDASKNPRPSRSVAKNPSAAAAEGKPTARKESIKRNLIERAQGTPIGSINYSIEKCFSRARSKERERERVTNFYARAYLYGLAHVHRWRRHLSTLLWYLKKKREERGACLGNLSSGRVKTLFKKRHTPLFEKKRKSFRGAIKNTATTNIFQCYLTRVLLTFNYLRNFRRR